MPGDVNIEAGLELPDPEVEFVVEVLPDVLLADPPQGLGKGAEFSPVG